MTSTTLPARPARRSTKGRTFPRDPIFAADIQKLLPVIVPKIPGSWLSQMVAQRDRALIICGWRSGLRIFELLNLEARDLIPEPRSVFVRRGKGGRQRYAGIDQWGWDEIQKWVRLREHLPSGPLFCQIKRPRAGARITDCYVRQQMVRYEQAAHLQKRFRPHQLRHGLATEMRREGMDVFTLKAQLGHLDLKTTERYAAELDPFHELQPVLDRRAPLVPLA